ncbi:Chromatin modification-related protein YNG2 [Pseudocercospora fuligena]|uniref:Chromatin modification-related protein YNG2 n=1 Tax=Pseudocercospora fuligena TaxID=685502 RepID=A0A8H6R8U1_9PEZI|nr:Chromatin modification-related protein YNG2 [Pseudocercospora fuligena]
MFTSSALGKRKRHRINDHRGGSRNYGSSSRKEINHQRVDSEEPHGAASNTNAHGARPSSPALLDDTKQDTEAPAAIAAARGDHEQQATEQNSLPTAQQKGKGRAKYIQSAYCEAFLKSRGNTAEDAIVIEDDGVAAHPPTCDQRGSSQTEEPRSRPALLAPQTHPTIVEERPAGEERVLEHHPLPLTAGHGAATAPSRDLPSSPEPRPGTSYRSESRKQELRKHYVQRIAELGRYYHSARDASPRLHNLRRGHQNVQRRWYQKLLAELGEPPVQNVSLYCYCNKPEGGDMIGCDGGDCKKKWFHFECAGIAAAPEEDEWFCRDCINKKD